MASTLCGLLRGMFDSDDGLLRHSFCADKYVSDPVAAAVILNYQREKSEVLIYLMWKIPSILNMMKNNTYKYAL